VRISKKVCGHSLKSGDLLMPIDPHGDGLVIALEGGHNFREVGGYLTTDGRRLRRGVLYRSGRMDELNRADVDRVGAIGLKAIIDLRRYRERAQNPTPDALLASARLYEWNSRIASNEELAADILRQGAGAAHYFATTLTLFSDLPRQLRRHLHAMCSAIADHELPLLIHCTAGKDRTGVSVGLLLSVLNVEQAAIRRDFAASERLLDWERLTAAGMKGVAAKDDWLAGLDPMMVATISRSDERYLQAALDAVVTAHGSIENFFRRAVGLNAGALDRLRDNLLEAS
jgi:protein-tyrosine phosphatase